MNLQKYIPFALMGCAALALYAKTAGTASAGVSELLELKTSVLGQLSAADKEIYDFDGNGAVNVLDLTMLSRSLLAETGGETVTADYAATAEYVNLVGRNYIDKGVTWLVQSGSAAEFLVTGTSAEITLAGDGAVYSDEKYRPRYAVYLDGVLLTDALLSAKTQNITLFSGDAQRQAAVKVIHLSEANNGAVGISKISVTSASKAPVLPTAKKALRIEFIGDSITCAYGVEGASQNESFSTSTENFMKSYAYLTAQKLDADYSAVCYSGHGVISGYTSSGEINTGSLVPDAYAMVGKNGSYARPWDFESNPCDVVVVNLGTNDYTYLSKDFEGRSPEFVSGYTEFLKDIRLKNPDAYIICTVGTMGCEDVYGLIEQAIEAFKSETKDVRITSYLSSVQKEANGYGSDWHPSEITQQLSAYVLADKICEALGIESDKIGLDAAENGVYDVLINAETGANASFYVGYDKSFWINMVNGGSSPSDIQAYIGDLSLKAGEYRLEFDYTSGVETDIPLYVDNFHSDILASGSEKKRYSQTFSVAADAEGCRIVFEVGGTNYYNVTISNLTLIKIS